MCFQSGRVTSPAGRLHDLHNQRGQLFSRQVIDQLYLSLRKARAMQHGLHLHIPLKIVFQNINAVLFGCVGYAQGFQHGGLIQF